MTGEEKLNDVFADAAPFYVQDLQTVCPYRKHTTLVSTHDTFVFHWMVPTPFEGNFISPREIRHFENQLNSSSNCDTVIIHAGVHSLSTNRFTSLKKKYKIGQPLKALSLDLDAILTKYRRLYTNNLYDNIHDKVYPLPLGIVRKEIDDFKYLRKNNKEHFCYANFSITHNYRGNIIRWANTQKYINCHFSKRFPDWDQQLDEKVFADAPLPFDEFLSTLASHKFCIVPNGVGIDTDRLWECIFMNVVPIVQNNYGNRIFSKIWPMILVDIYEFSDIPRLAAEFEKQHGTNIQYNHDLLLRKNLPELMDRIEHECRVKA